MANTPVFSTPNFPHKLLDKLSPILSSGDFHHGDNLETMSTSSSSAKLYSIRLNRKSRVMLARVVVNGVSGWLLVEELKNHNYKDAQSLKRGWLDQYLKKHGQRLSKEHRALLDALQDRAEESVGELEYHNEHWIVLSNEQNQAHRASYPLIIPGMPGTGKSVLALSLLKRELDGDDNNADDVLYVTKSPELADRMRGILDETPELAAKPTVLDFASLPAEMRGQPEGVAAGEAECLEWLAQDKLKLSWKALGYASSEQLHRYLYREFRILSGCDDEAAYFALGRRQSLFDEEERAEIYRIYARYISSEQGRHDFSLVRVKPTTLKRYKAIFVDESQDCSDAELLDLYDLCDGRIVYLIDSNQSLLDVHSKIEVLKRRLGRELEVIVLPLSFRCSNSVTRAANALLNVKHQVMGGVLEKNATTQVKNHTGAEEGQAIWVEHVQNDSSVDRTDLDTLKQTMGSTQRIVVTWPKYFAEVKRLFPGAIVATPEQVKGLEYDEVVAYHLLDEEHFTAISRLLSAEGASAFFESGSRAKAANDRRELGPDLNQVFTAYTRACKTLYVMEDSNTHKTKVLMQRMRQAFTQDQIKTTLAASSAEEWRKQAEKYIKEKRFALAQQICDTHLGVGVYESLMPGLNNDSRSASTSDTKQVPPTPAIVTKENDPESTTKRAPPKKRSKAVVANSEKKNTPLPVATATPASTQETKKVQDSFLAAIKSGNLREVKKQIKRGANPHQELIHRITPMLIAADEGHLDIVEYLHQLGGDLSHEAADGFNVLAYACQKGNVPLARYCHQSGMYLNLRFKIANGPTPLILAIQKGHLNMVNYLCESGANPNKKSQSGVSPLNIAVGNANHQTVRCLCEKGANPNLSGQLHDIGEISPIHVAVFTGDLSLVEYLHQKGARLDGIVQPTSHTPLHSAAKLGVLEIVRYLVRHSSWLNTISSEGFSPLIWAAEGGHVSVVKELIASGADMHIQSDLGLNALFAAVGSGHLDVVKCLHEAGMDLNSKSSKNVSVLQFAIECKKFDIVSYLINAGVDLNSPDISKQTAVHMAAKEGHIGVLSQLAKAKANFNVLNVNNESPMHLAKDNNTLKMLKLGGANVDVFSYSHVDQTPLYCAMAAKDFNRAKCLVEECGADPKPANNYDLMSPMFYALLAGDRQFTELFLKNRGNSSDRFLIHMQFFRNRLITPDIQNRLDYLLQIKLPSSTTTMRTRLFNFFNLDDRKIEFTANEIVWLMSKDSLFSLFPVPEYLADYGVDEQAANS